MSFIIEYKMNKTNPNPTNQWSDTSSHKRIVICLTLDASNLNKSLFKTKPVSFLYALVKNRRLLINLLFKEGCLLTPFCKISLARIHFVNEIFIEKLFSND